MYEDNPRPSHPSKMKIILSLIIKIIIERTNIIKSIENFLSSFFGM